MTNKRQKISVSELRLLQIQILDKVCEFCKSNNIRISLGYGTLLGAVRHKGYIPWDDDIDILMPYPDYKKFLSTFASFDKNLNVQSMDNDDRYRFTFAKVYDNRTILKEKTILTGVYIDIYPVIGFPKKEEFESFVNEFRALYRPLKKMTFRYNLNIFQRLLIKIKQLYKPSRQQIVARIEDIYERYPFDGAEYGGVIPYNFTYKRYLKANIFRDYSTLTFEGKEYPVIKDYDTYLKSTYGDYMQLPPKEKQVSKHIFKAYWKN
ncbi:MAG: LicD family protein [Bacteroidota bacterium]|nr:LicD family protein [Bacteroidota bacterium]